MQLNFFKGLVCLVKGHDTSPGGWQHIVVTSDHGNSKARISCNRCGKIVETEDIVIERDGSTFSIVDKRSGSVDSDNDCNEIWDHQIGSTKYYDGDIEYDTKKKEI